MAHAAATMSLKISDGTALYERFLRDYPIMNAVDAIVQVFLSKSADGADGADDDKETQNIVTLVTHLVNLLQTYGETWSLKSSDWVDLLNHFHDYIVPQLQCATFDEAAFTTTFQACSARRAIELPLTLQGRPKIMQGVSCCPVQ